MISDKSILRSVNNSSSEIIFIFFKESILPTLTCSINSKRLFDFTNLRVFIESLSKIL